MSRSPRSAKKKPTWGSTLAMLLHVGLLCNEPPGSAEVLFVQSSDPQSHSWRDLRHGKAAPTPSLYRGGGGKQANVESLSVREPGVACTAPSSVDIMEAIRGRGRAHGRQ